MNYFKMLPLLLTIVSLCSSLPVDGQFPHSCDDFSDRVTGVRTIYPDGKTAVETYCEYGTSGGALTAIQTRDLHDRVNDHFNSTYDAYKKYFGKAGKGRNYWMGLDNIYSLVKDGTYSLRIDICCHDTAVQQQIYSKFTLGDEASGYVLQATAATPGIGLDFYNSKTRLKDIGAKFNTFDTLTEEFRDKCDVIRYYGQEKSPIFDHGTGGWWFGTCGNNLNSHFVGDADVGTEGVCRTKEPPTANCPGVEIRTTTGKYIYDGVHGRYFDGHSYNRVRMSVYKTNDTPLGLDPNAFCRDQ